jgi:hypothetical protein
MLGWAAISRLPSFFFFFFFFSSFFLSLVEFNFTDLPAMPQERLPFVQWSHRRESSISGDFLEFSGQQLDDLDVSQKSKCLPTRPPIVSTTSSTKPRTSWVFSYMPDEEVGMRYYNHRTRKEEWRCKHCDKTCASLAAAVE